MDVQPYDRDLEGRCQLVFNFFPASIEIIDSLGNTTTVTGIRFWSLEFSDFNTRAFIEQNPHILLRMNNDRIQINSEQDYDIFCRNLNTLLSGWTPQLRPVCFSVINPNFTLPQTQVIMRRLQLSWHLDGENSDLLLIFDHNTLEARTTQQVDGGFEIIRFIQDVRPHE